MKATSVFGGVQVFQIVIGIVRSKFIAVLLGPFGMGIAGLLTATTGMVTALTSFGLSTSAVKDVSAAYSTGDERRLGIIAKVVSRLVWCTGLLGTIITAILSPWLSELTFGNRDYTIAFIWLSVTLLLNQLSAGQSVMLRGTRQIANMAKASVTGSVIGLFTTIPLYYFYGVKGIVPAIIISAFTSLLLTWYYAKKLHVEQVPVSRRQTVAEGKEMMKMGFMISLSGMITLAASYVVRIFISKSGGVDEVGMYNAGFAIISTYVGMIFTAMATDYYPRLSAVADDKVERRNVMNQQAEIAILILAPILIAFLVFIKWAVILLYSKQFLPITGMIQWAALGMLFKAASWSVAFILLAKGASKLFFWNELITNVYLLVANLIGYYYFGLNGLGISFLVSYILYLLQVYYVAKFKFGFSFDSSFKRIFSIQIGLAFLSFFIVKFLSSGYAYTMGTILIIFSALYSYRELDKRLDIASMLASIKNRFK